MSPALRNLSDWHAISGKHFPSWKIWPAKMRHAVVPCRPEVVPGIILGNANRSFSRYHFFCFDGLCGEDVSYSDMKHGSPEHRGHLVEAHDQLSSLNLLNRKGGRNRVKALCEEQYKDGVALWKQFTDIFRDTMICLVEFSRFFG